MQITPPKVFVFWLLSVVVFQSLAYPHQMARASTPAGALQQETPYVDTTQPRERSPAHYLGLDNMTWLNVPRQIREAAFSAGMPTVVLIDKHRFRTYVLQLQGDNEVVLTLSIPNAVGMAGWDTPAGYYIVRQVLFDPVWINPFDGTAHPPFSKDSTNPMGVGAITLWGCTDSGACARPVPFALHGTSSSTGGPTSSGPASIGHAASHSCVRHRNPDWRKLADKVQSGTPVIVVNAVDANTLVPFRQ